MLTRVLLLLALLILPTQGWAAVASDNEVSLGNGTTSLSASSFATTGSDVVLLCGILQDSSTAPSGTYNSGSFTWSAGTNVALANPTYYVFLGHLAVGSGATSNIAITAGAGAGDIWGDCASYTGVDQTTPIEAAGGAEDVSGAGTIAVTLTTLTDNAWMVAYSYDTDGTASTAGSGTVRRQLNSAVGIVAVFDSDAALTPAGSHSLNIVQTSGPSTYRSAVLKPSGGAPPPSVVPKALLLGVGP